MINKQKSYSSKRRRACAVAVAQCWMNSYPELTWALNSEVLQSQVCGFTDKGKHRAPVRLLYKTMIRDVSSVLYKKASIAPIDRLIRLTLWIKRKGYLGVYNKDEVSLLLSALWSYSRINGSIDGFTYTQFTDPIPFLKPFRMT